MANCVTARIFLLSIVLAGKLYVIMGGFRGVSGVSGNPLGVSQVFPQLLFTAK